MWDDSEVKNDNKDVHGYIIRAKGFAFGCTAMDLAEFFAGCDIKGGKKNGVHFIYNSAGRTNEAYIEFYAEDDVERALTFHKKFIKERYVEVIRSDRDAMEEAISHGLDPALVCESYIVKIMGMPFTALHEDVATFLAGCDIAGGKRKGIHFLRNPDGSAAGGCYVELLAAEDLKAAVSKDRNFMGQRFCQVFKVSKDDMDTQIKKQNEVLLDITEPIVKLKGLPYRSTEEDIRNFFPNLDIISVEMVLNDQGCCRGEAFIDFGCLEDAKSALQSYKLKLAHRYIDVTKSGKSEWLQLIPSTEKVAKTADDLDEPILKLDNLPGKVTRQEIIDFFFGIEVRALQIVKLTRGDCNGEAFVEFLNEKDAAKALSKNKQPFNADSGATVEIAVSASSRCDWRKNPLKHTPREESPVRIGIRKRPLVLDHSSSDRHGPQPRLSRSSMSEELQSVVSYGERHSCGSIPIVEGYRREFLVNAVGLPFSATEEDVRKFFSPLLIVEVELLKTERGQNRGIAVVGFYSEEDRNRAMMKNKQSIGKRYVNLYIRNEPREYNFDFAKGSRSRNIERPRPSGISMQHDFYPPRRESHGEGRLRHDSRRY